MTNLTNPKDPFHGITLEMVVNRLVKHYGWDKLAEMISVKCFKSNQSVSSTLKFLRQTPWARTKVEQLYLKTEFLDEPPVKSPKKEKDFS
ncbi:MAG: VF530 family DNA-binding protein [Deferribacterales bacterium]